MHDADEFVDISDQLGAIIADVLKKEKVKLPDYAFQAVKGFQKELADDVTRLLKTRARRVKLVKDIEALDAGQLPPGHPPFKLKVNPIELQNSVREEITFSVTVPAGTSYFDAKAIIHRQSIRWNKDIDKLINDDQEERFLCATDYNGFLRKCAAPTQQRLATIADMRLRLPPGLKPPSTADGLSEPLATRLYFDTIDKVAAYEERYRTALQKQADDRKKVVEELSKRTPKERWLQEISSALARKSPGAESRGAFVVDHHAINQGGDIENNVQIRREVPVGMKWNAKKGVFVERTPKKQKSKSPYDEPKNQASPGAGRGHSSKNRGNAQTKGLAKGKNKGKGKGKAGKEWSAVPQGQGRGNNDKGGGKGKGKPMGKGKSKGKGKAKGKPWP